MNTVSVNSLPSLLTKRQQEVFNFLRHTRDESGVMPSTREIQLHFGFASQTAAVEVLRAMERKGVLRRLPGKARGIVLNIPQEESQAGDSLRIPVLGEVSAGRAVESTDFQERPLLVDPRLHGLEGKRHLFALKVRGDSMIGAHILNGDYVILERRRSAVDQDIVAVLIEGQSTLKRFQVKNGQAWLKSENPAQPDLTPMGEMLIQGIMCGLVRGSVQ